MKKNRKQMAAAALAIGLAVAGTTGAYGAPDAAVAEVITEEKTGANAVETTLNGRINATTLSVSIPLTAAFDIDPTKFDGTSPNANVQVGDNQSSGYKVVNNSAVPVYVYVSGVTVPTSGVSLVDNVGALDSNKALMLAISEKESAASSDITDTSFWLKTTMSGNYYMDKNRANKGKLDANGGTMNLKIYGMTKQGWSVADTFSIKPSFTVAVTAPS